MPAWMNRNRGFTMIEVFAVLLLISLLVMLLLPAVQSAREMARRTSCANNLTQVGLGIHAYHSAFNQYPVQLTGTDGSVVAGEDNDRRLSFLVGLLPFLGQRQLLESIDSPLPFDPYVGNAFGMGMWSDDGMEGMMLGVEQEVDPAVDEQPEREHWPVGGPEPFNGQYGPWRTEIAVFRCPSDPGMGDPAFARTNYAACIGDGAVAADTGPMKEVNGRFVMDEQLAAQTSTAMRGIFVPRVVTRSSDVTDGLSHTIIVGEIATDLGDVCMRTEPVATPAEISLRDNPAWVRRSNLFDPQRPDFWQANNLQGQLRTGRGLRRGLRWSDGMPLYTGFNTILPPNREIVLRDDSDASWGILSTSSRHQGGAHVALADASTRFINNSIDAGDDGAPTVHLESKNPPGSESPYGVWGALGTRATAELNVYRHDLGLNVE